MPKWRRNSSQKGWQTDIIHIFSAPTCIDIVCQPTPGCCWLKMHLCRELSLKQSKPFNIVPNTFKRSMIVQNPPQRFKIRNDLKFSKKAESGTSSTSCCCLSCSSFVLQSSIIITCQRISATAPADLIITQRRKIQSVFWNRLLHSH